MSEQAKSTISYLSNSWSSCLKVPTIYVLMTDLAFFNQEVVKYIVQSGW